MADPLVCAMDRGGLDALVQLLNRTFPGAEVTEGHMRTLKEKHNYQPLMISIYPADNIRPEHTEPIRRCIEYIFQMSLDSVKSTHSPALFLSPTHVYMALVRRRDGNNLLYITYKSLLYMPASMHTTFQTNTLHFITHVHTLGGVPSMSADNIAFDVISRCPAYRLTQGIDIFDFIHISSGLLKNGAKGHELQHIPLAKLIIQYIQNGDWGASLTQVSGLNILADTQGTLYRLYYNVENERKLTTDGDKCFTMSVLKHPRISEAFTLVRTVYQDLVRDVGTMQTQSLTAGICDNTDRLCQFKKNFGTEFANFDVYPTATDIIQNTDTMRFVTSNGFEIHNKYTAAMDTAFRDIAKFILEPESEGTIRMDKAETSYKFVNSSSSVVFDLFSETSFRITINIPDVNAQFNRDILADYNSDADTEYDPVFEVGNTEDDAISIGSFSSDSD